MPIKYGQIMAMVILGALTVGSISVMGLLQSTERISSTGLIVRPVEDTVIIPAPSSSDPAPPPPEPKIEIKVYSELACTNIVSDVEWGDIEAGDVSDVQLYVKNSGDTSVIISLDTENWSSNTAMENMNLSWDYNGQSIEPGEARPVTLTLSVDSDCPELDSFGFDIIIIGS